MLDVDLIDSKCHILDVECLILIKLIILLMLIMLLMLINNDELNWFESVVFIIKIRNIHYSKFITNLHEYPFILRSGVSLRCNENRQ